MSKIFRRNIFTGEEEWVDVDASDFASVATKDPRKSYSTAYSTPHVSVGAGCHSGQVAEFNEFYKSHNIVGAYHREDGALVSDSNRAFNRVLKVRGLYNRDAGYSDHAGDSRE